MGSKLAQDALFLTPWTGLLDLGMGAQEARGADSCSQRSISKSPRDANPWAFLFPGTDLVMVSPYLGRREAQCAGETS